MKNLEDPTGRKTISRTLTGISHSIPWKETVW
ncbi:hypothetical protein NP493_246g02104 [Ridgeia piscesae]|uniref:Uncharacterized protein n=1 Tax=Ridgeia piscesae TaxID=27915 RepID=A0AAD9UDA9_RIDPI|nr:hypothetical protein NP493_246g02104 [Ridgeia piscesae]